MSISFDLSLLRPFSDDLWNDELYTAPYLAHFEGPENLLTFVVVRHGCGLNHPVFRTIKYALQPSGEHSGPDFIITQNCPSHYGTNPQNLIDLAHLAAKKDFVRHEEYLYAIHLASMMDVPFMGGEGKHDEILNKLLGLHDITERDYLNFLVLRMMISAKRENDPKLHNLAEFVKDKKAALHAFKASQKISYEDFQRWFKEKMHFHFDIRELDDQMIKPVQSKTHFIQNFSNHVAMVRDKHTLRVLRDVLTHRRQVVMIYGGSHFLRMKKVLEAALGQCYYEKPPFLLEKDISHRQKMPPILGTFFTPISLASHPLV